MPYRMTLSVRHRAIEVHYYYYYYYTNFFTINKNMGREHMYKFVKNRSRLNVKAHFFSQRVVNDWNKLPTNVMNADTVNSF